MGGGPTNISGNLINLGNGGLLISGPGAVTINGSVNLGAGNLTDTSTGPVIINGAISGTYPGTPTTHGLNGYYYAINTTAIPEAKFKNNILDPVLNGKLNAQWLGSFTASQYNTYLFAPDAANQLE